MSFARPELLLLLFLIPLALLSRRALRRRRRVEASAWLLWQRALEKAAAAPRRRRPSRQELLRALPLLLVLLAAAGPFLPSGATPRSLVIIDRSASMGRLDGEGTTRLARLRRRVEELPGNPRLVAFPPPPLPELLWTPSIREVEVGAFRRQAALQRRGEVSAWVASDRSDAIPEGFGALLPERSTAPNGQIEALSVSPEGTGFVVVSGGKGRRLRWKQNGPGDGKSWEQVLSEDLVRLEVPGEPPESGARIEVVLEGGPDDDPRDDRALLVVPPPALRVAAPPRGFELLARALAAHPAVELVRGGGRSGLSLGLLSPDEQGWSLLIPPLPAGVGLALSGVVVPSVPVACSGALDGFPLGDMPVARIHRLERVPDGAETLLVSGSLPVLLRLPEERRFVLLVDPEDEAEWSASASFPKLAAAIVQLLVGASGSGSIGRPGGGLVELPLPPGTRATLRLPGGEEQALTADGDGLLRSVLDQPGLHHLVREGGEERVFAAWGVEPGDVGQAGPALTRAPRPEGSSRSERLSLVPYLAVAALAVLLVLERRSLFPRRAA